MPRKRPKTTIHKQVAIFFLEGYSEDIFYYQVLSKHCIGIPKRIINVKGLYNIHRNVLGKTIESLRKNPDYFIRIYCCIDRESRDKSPLLDIDELKKDILADRELRKKVLSVEIILATQMLESWFFHDIDGIYKFLRTPVAIRNPRKFSTVEKFSWIELNKLFGAAGKVYLKGEKSEGFIEHLNLDKIYSKCQELRQGIENVKANSKHFRNLM